MQELLSLSGESTAEEEIVQKLANASLLTIEGDLSQKDAFVEVAHEALVRNWSQLRKWIDADRAGLRTQTRLSESACDWKNAGRDTAWRHYASAFPDALSRYGPDQPHAGALMSVELFRYLGAAKDGGTLEYIFEAGEQVNRILQTP